MRTLLRLIVVVALILGVIWLIQNRKAPSRQEVRSGVDSAVHETKEAVKDLNVPNISEELKRTGRIVRRKATQAAHELADATEGAETTAAIKAKLALDPKLSAFDIAVNTTYGRVTLSGRADSPEDIARAVQIALERDDVREVVSTIQVRTPEDKNVTLVR